MFQYIRKDKETNEMPNIFKNAANMKLKRISKCILMKYDVIA